MNRLVPAIISIFGFACMQEDPEIGSDFFNEVSFEIVSWDTLTVDMYTIHIDSVETNSPARLLAGEVEHNELGLIEAEAYFQLSPDLEYSVDDLKDGEFQDAFLTLYYDRYYYGDTTALMQLEVYELAEEMELDDELKLYNHSTFEIKSDLTNQAISLGSYTFSPRPYAQDSVEIPLEDTFAKALFEVLKEDQIATGDFLDLLHGLKIRSLTTGAIIGFQPALALKLNYLDKSESVSVERTLYLTSSTTAIQFNHIEAEGIDGVFPDSEEEKLSSELTNNLAYVQSGLGLAIRVEMPYLKHLLSADETPLIDEVKLELVFENEIPEEVYMLTSGLTLRKVDHNNQVIFEYDEVAELVLDIEYDEERKFVLDVSEFVIEQLSIGTQDNHDALLIQFPEEYALSTLNHLIVSDQEKSNESSKIILNVLNIK